MKVAKTVTFILVCLILLWLIFLLLSKAFSAGSKTTTPTVTSPDLITYANTDSVTAMYIDGPVQADQSHEAFRVSVSRSQVKVELLNGYEGQVVKQQVFENNSISYGNFLKALDRAAFDRAVNKTVTTDERGFCPLRNRFIYTLDNGGDEVVRSWSSSCGGGNYTGDRALTRQLFLNQIPRDALREMFRGSKLSTS